MRTLDVGCGCNKLLGSIGIDISRKTDADILAHAQHLPFRDETFGLVQCHCVLEHLDNPKEAASEVMRVLKFEGTFICRLTPRKYTNPLYVVLAQIVFNFPFSFLGLKGILKFVRGIQKRDPTYFHKSRITKIVFQGFSIEKEERLFSKPIWSCLYQGRKGRLFSKFLKLPKWRWGGVESLTMKKSLAFLVVSKHV